MTDILVTAGEKGGVGKTMLATSLATCFVQAGFDALLVDADGQRSSTRWATARAELLSKNVPSTLASMPVRVPWIALQGNAYYPLRDMAGRYDFIVVDAGGADSQEFRTACAAARALYSPIIPSDCDLGTLPQVREVVAQVRAAGNFDLLAKVVFNKASTHKHATDVAEACDYVTREGLGLLTANAVVHHRDAFKHAYKARLTVTELATIHMTRSVRQLARQAADEIAAVFAEVCGDLGVRVPAVPGVPEVQQVQEVQ